MKQITQIFLEGENLTLNQSDNGSGIRITL